MSAESAFFRRNKELLAIYHSKLGKTFQKYQKHPKSKGPRQSASTAPEQPSKGGHQISTKITTAKITSPKNFRTTKNVSIFKIGAGAEI
jgi:hypothetical protein